MTEEMEDRWLEWQEKVKSTNKETVEMNEMDESV